jgi:hypothetical protein
MEGFDLVGQRASPLSKFRDFLPWTLLSERGPRFFVFSIELQVSSDTSPGIGRELFANWLGHEQTCHRHRPSAVFIDATTRCVS